VHEDDGGAGDRLAELIDDRAVAKMSIRKTRGRQASASRERRDTFMALLPASHAPWM
jgi:hypothetical protein